MTIFASYPELTDKRRFGQYKFSNYGERADLSEKGAEMTTFSSYLEFTQKRSFGYYMSLNWIITKVLTKRNETNDFCSFC